MQQSLIDRDEQVNWHPYSQMKTTKHLPIVRGEGTCLFDAEGKRYLDMVSSWWVTLHGHGNRYIAQKVYEQLSTLEQVIFAGFTHPSAIELSERLLALLPENQSKVFYTDNGSTAVEVALKMCIQYSFNKGMKKTKILAFTNGYHGDTFGAMSVSARSIWTAPFEEYLFEVIFIDPPNEGNLSEIKALIGKHAQDIACFIYEPLVQGAGGMLMHRAEDLSELLGYCRNQGILMIQDEVFVGFSRTGELFAANQLSAKPDVMCFSKGLTGGTMPMGLTTCTQELYDAFYADNKKKALFHGHSFTANPVACAASLASLDLLLQKETQDRIKNIVKQHAIFAERLKRYSNIRDVRQTGTILAFDYQTDSHTSYFNQIQSYINNYFLDQGIVIRPLGNVIYLLPPYCVKDEELSYVYDQIIEFLENH